MEKPITLKIEKITDEAKGIKSFFFNYNINGRPGQFVMVWLPRVNEKPFGVSFQNKKMFSITVSKVGDFTEKLFELKKGDYLGIRGPYGTNFNLHGSNIAVVAGGYGAAPLAFLADDAAKKGINIDFIIGARTKDRLMFIERLKNIGNLALHIATDDGSLGKKCFTTDILGEILEKKKIDKIFAVGPEIMMKKVVDISLKKQIPCEISMERYIKCGFGICGSCCVDNLGIRMCKEGPVINSELASKIFEFGKYKRDNSGKIESFTS